MGKYVQVVEIDLEGNFIVYLKTDDGVNIKASEATTDTLDKVIEDLCGDETYEIRYETKVSKEEEDVAIESTNPLIIIFYLDRLMFTNDVLPMYVDSINEYINSRNANVMAFFLPTDGGERVECINPLLVEKPDLDKINQLIKDIKEKFEIDESI